jgi:hypothetical protein
VSLHVLSKAYIKKVLKLNPAVPEQSDVGCCAVGCDFLLPVEAEIRSALFL